MRHLAAREACAGRRLCSRRRRRAARACSAATRARRIGRRSPLPASAPPACAQTCASVRPCQRRENMCEWEEGSWGDGGKRESVRLLDRCRSHIVTHHPPSAFRVSPFRICSYFEQIPDKTTVGCGLLHTSLHPASSTTADTQKTIVKSNPCTLLQVGVPGFGFRVSRSISTVLLPGLLNVKVERTLGWCSAP